MHDFWQSLLIAFSLMLILEGVIPFLYPHRWRKLVSQLATISPSRMRMMGLASMLVGVLMLWLVN